MKNSCFAWPSQLNTRRQQTAIASGSFSFDCPLKGDAPKARWEIRVAGADVSYYPCQYLQPAFFLAHQGESDCLITLARVNISSPLQSLRLVCLRASAR